MSFPFSFSLYAYTDVILSRNLTQLGNYASLNNYIITQLAHLWLQQIAPIYPN